MMSAYSTLNRFSLIQLIGIAAQPPAHDLFAKKLRAESPDAEDMGDRVGIPAFRQHGNRNDTADLFAQTVLLADGVHDLTEQFGVRISPTSPAPERCFISRLNCSISSAAIARKL